MNNYVDGIEVIPAGEKIGLITDCHGMLEPLKAALEDMRKRGVTRIYSLGDNIGSGVNPKEVLDLLDEYGVISIAGNAEDYITLGIEPFSSYINEYSRGGEERIRNIEWTKSQLTAEQIKKIKLYPRFVELILGGKKIALCHFFTDVRFNHGYFGERKYQRAISDNNVSYLREFYDIINSDKEKEFINQSILESDYRWRNPMSENPYTRGLRSAQTNPLFNGKKITYYDAIFQGHIHWRLFDPKKEGFSPDIYSIRAVGMGARENSSDMNKASYVILTSLEEGFRVEEICDVDYDRESMITSIRNSDGNNYNIRRFVGIDGDDSYKR